MLFAFRTPLGALALLRTISPARSHCSSHDQFKYAAATLCARRTPAQKQQHPAPAASIICAGGNNEMAGSAEQSTNWLLSLSLSANFIRAQTSRNELLRLCAWGFLLSLRMP
jgi:hypothetical protein